MALSSKPWNRTLFIWTNFLTITHIEFCDILLLEQKLVLLVSTSTNLNPSSNLWTKVYNPSMNSCRSLRCTLNSNGPRGHRPFGAGRYCPFAWVVEPWIITVKQRCIREWRNIIIIFLNLGPRRCRLVLGFKNKSNRSSWIHVSSLLQSSLLQAYSRLCLSCSSKF